MSTACANPSRLRGSARTLSAVSLLLPQKDGEPLTFRSQHARLVPLRVWFRWMTRQNHILHNPASEIELPRLGRTLPKTILSVEEVERIMTLCEVEEPIGLRDRAILETSMQPACGVWKWCA